MIPDALPAARPLQGSASRAVLFLAALLVGAAGAYAGAVSELGISGVALGCALIALLAALATRRDSEKRAFSTGERCLLGLATLAALQVVPLGADFRMLFAMYSYEAMETRNYFPVDHVRASFDAGATWRAALLLLGLAYFLRALRTAGARGGALVLARALALVLLAHSAVALLHGSYGQRDMLLGGFEATNPLTAWGTFVNRLQFSAFSTALLGSAFALCFASRRLFDRALGGLAAALGVAATAMSGSRAGLLGAGLSVAVAVVAAAPRGRRFRVVAAFGVVAVILVGLRAAGWEPLERVLPLRPGEEKRVEIWKGTLNLAAEQPLAGIGFRAFPYAYGGDRRPVANRWVTTAESDVLEVAAEGGFIGLGLVGFGLVAGIRSMRKRRKETDDAGRRASAIAASGLVGLVPLTLVASTLHAPAVLLAAAASWALVGLLAAPAAPTPP